MPGWLWATFLGRICLILGGGLAPCPDSLGHFFRRRSAPECPLECGGRGVQLLKGQCPNAFGIKFGGASLNQLISYPVHHQLNINSSVQQFISSSFHLFIISSVHQFISSSSVHQFISSSVHQAISLSVHQFISLSVH